MEDLDLNAVPQQPDPTVPQELQQQQYRLVAPALDSKATIAQLLVQANNCAAQLGWLAGWTDS
mgnify:CR=1 FL=1